MRYMKKESAEHFKEIIIILVKNKKNAKKCEECNTLSLISYADKILLSTIDRRLYGNLN